MNGQPMLPKWPNDRSSHKILCSPCKEFLGRNGKAEDAKLQRRRNSPEAVPNGTGGMKAKNETSRTFFWEREAQSARDARSRIACWWIADEERGGIAALG
jgi:hypothetical protein